MLLDLFLISSSSRNKQYDKITQIIRIWADRTAIKTDNTIRDKKSRTLSFTDDKGNKYSINIKTLRWGRLIVTAKNNIDNTKEQNWKKKCNSSNLMIVLFESYGVVEQWIFKSGNTRTIN